MRIEANRLKRIATQLFAAAGSDAHEAERIGHYLVEANLAGHDSHGVIRIHYYLQWAEKGLVIPNQRVKVEFQTEAFAVLDGCSGYGQVIGEQAMELGIEMAQKYGTATVALRNTGHLGRIGDWPEYLARKGMASFHFVNTTGLGLLVAPFGGIDRRLSANPIAAGIPVAGKSPIILDISTCGIAEGKLKVARNSGKQVPEGCIIDHEGNPTTDPNKFYDEPHGALLPIAGHKGYGLGIIAEMFAGAMTGGGCSNPEERRQLHNGMLSFIVDVNRLPHSEFYTEDIRRYVEFVKSSRRREGVDEILLPGEIEDKRRADRSANGIEIDETTWGTIADACRKYDVALEA